MILSVAIITKEGVPLVARQYRPIERSQISGYLTEFPKYITQESRSFIDVQNIRYVFKVIGNFYFVMITSIESNILDDLELLDQLVSSTQKIVGVEFDKEDSSKVIKSQAFNLIFAFDEYIFDGYRQNVSENDVTEFLLMKSETEEEYLREIQQKQQAAQRDAIEKIQKMNAEKKQRRHMDSVSNVASSSPYGAVSSESSGQNTNNYSGYPGAIAESEAYGSYSASAASGAASRVPSTGSGARRGQSTNARSGMKLQQRGKPHKIDEIMQSEDIPKHSQPQKGFGNQNPEKQDFGKGDFGNEENYNTEVVLRIEETFEARDGRVVLAGSLFGCGQKGQIYTVQTERDETNSRRFPFRSLGGAGKSFAEDGTLRLKGSGLTSESPLLGWKSPTSDPLEISPITTNPRSRKEAITMFDITIQPKIALDQLSLAITVPAPESAISIEEQDRWGVRMEEDKVVWTRDHVEADEELEIEFTVKQKLSEEDFYPIHVMFNGDSTFFETQTSFEVKGVTSNSDSSPVTFTVVKSTSADYELLQPPA